LKHCNSICDLITDLHYRRLCQPSVPYHNPSPGCLAGPWWRRPLAVERRKVLLLVTTAATGDLHKHR